MQRHFSTLFILLISLTVLQAQSKQLTLKDVTGGRTSRSNSIAGVKWISGGTKFSFIKFDSEKKQNVLCEHDVETGTEMEIISSAELTEKSGGTFSIHNYMWSPDENYLLFSGVLPARSLKTGGTFYIINVKNKSTVLYVESEEEQAILKFSPDSKKIGFVRGNNIYTADISTGLITQYTFDGSENILNGKFDWAYEEEFSIIDGWEWSPDSRSIAFWRMDQSKIPDIHIAKWDSVNLNFHKMRYPKAGFPNAEVKIGTINISDGNINWMDLGNDNDIYVPRIKFTSDPGLLSVQRLNRLQNHMELLFFDIKTGKSTTVVDEKSETWIDVYDDLSFLTKEKKFIWTSDKDGFKHIYLYDYTGKLLNQITSGKWEVIEVTAVDDKRGLIYYISNERGRRFKDLYSIKINGKDKKRISEEAGVHSINMSSGSQYYIDKYSNANTLASTFLMRSNGIKIRDLITADMSVYADYNLPPAEFFTFRTSDYFELDAFIVKPADFNMMKKYPVLIVQYNGPGSQSVSDSWGASGLWERMLTQNGFIIVGVDCRITAGRGNIHKKYAYKNLGYWETNDLIETVKYLRGLTYVDSENIGIWGWSYGGYTSALAILKAADYFKAAVAVAPVTHWKFYDSIYTERYMSTPQLNPDGYESSSPLNYADKLKGKFLLIHGTGDDNVHFQNSVKLVEKLIESDKQFNTMFYPEKDHGIYGGNTRHQLYEMVTRFLIEHLKNEKVSNTL